MITNTIKKTIHAALCLLTLSPLTAMEIDRTNTPFNQLPELPIEVWRKTGSIDAILTPQDALAFQLTCHAAQENTYHRKVGIALMNGASTMNPYVFKLASYMTDSEAKLSYYIPIFHNFISQNSKTICDVMGWENPPYKEKALELEKAGVLSMSLVLENIDLNELMGILPFFTTFFKNVKTIKFFRPKNNTYKMVNPTDAYFQTFSESGILDKLMDFEVEDAIDISNDRVTLLEKCFDVCIKEKVIGNHKERSITARRKLTLTQPMQITTTQ